MVKVWSIWCACHVYMSIPTHAYIHTHTRTSPLCIICYLSDQGAGAEGSKQETHETNEEYLYGQRNHPTTSENKYQWNSCLEEVPPMARVHGISAVTFRCSVGILSFMVVFVFLAV